MSPKRLLGILTPGLALVLLPAAPADAQVNIQCPCDLTTTATASTL